jgi:hypothetical protein
MVLHLLMQTSLLALQSEHSNLIQYCFIKIYYLRATFFVVLAFFLKIGLD